MHRRGHSYKIERIGFACSQHIQKILERTMEKSEVRERIVKVVCDVLGVDAGIIEDDSHFVFDLGAESTQSVQLVAAFEEEFNIEMDGEAALSVETIGGAVDFIADVVNS